MDRSEKAMEEVQRAKRFGVRVKFRCGVAFLELAATGDYAMQEESVEKLAKYAPEVHAAAEKEWIFAHSKYLVGQRVWYHERGIGTVTYVGTDGRLTISFEQIGNQHSTAIEAYPNQVLVLVDETSGTDEAAPSQSQTELNPPGPVKKFLSGIMGR